MVYSAQVPEGRAEWHPTYGLISRRLKDIGVDFMKFYAGGLKVYESKLDGIEFKTKVPATPLDGDDFLTALRIATKGTRPAMREGKKFENDHWAVDASMGATVGIGFREITYLEAPKKWTRASDPNSLSMNPQADPVFAAQFDRNSMQLEISSLHAAVWGDLAKVHIDETGFVLQAIPGLSDDVSMTPDFLQHTLLELIWKDKLHIPDSIEIFVPNSANAFSAFGITARVGTPKSLEFKTTVAYNVRGENGWSLTAKLTKDW